jgi:hypothetical protein
LFLVTSAVFSFLRGKTEKSFICGIFILFITLSAITAVEQRRQQR